MHNSSMFQRAMQRGRLLNGLFLCGNSLMLLSVSAVAVQSVCFLLNWLNGVLL